MGCLFSRGGYTSLAAAHDPLPKVAWDYNVPLDRVSIVKQRTDRGSGDYEINVDGVGIVRYTRAGTVFMAAAGNPPPAEMQIDSATLKQAPSGLAKKVSDASCSLLTTVCVARDV